MSPEQPLLRLHSGPHKHLHTSTEINTHTYTKNYITLNRPVLENNGLSWAIFIRWVFINRLRDIDFAPLWFTVWRARVSEYWWSQHWSNVLIKDNQSADHSWLKYVTEGLTWLWFMGQLLSCVSRQFLTACLHSQETIHDWFCNLSFGGTSCISFWKPTFLPPSWWCYPGFRFGSLLIRFLRELALVRSSPGQVLRTRCLLMFAGSL